MSTCQRLINHILQGDIESNLHSLTILHFLLLAADDTAIEVDKIQTIYDTYVAMFSDDTQAGRAKIRLLPLDQHFFIIETMMTVQLAPDDSAYA